jgi:hypothetical protein
MADGDIREIAATLAAAVISKSDCGVPAEDAAATYFEVLSVLQKKTLTARAQTSPVKIGDGENVSGTTTRTEIYHSENGDRWFLCRQDNGHAYIEHKANLPSGGRVTSIEIGDFLGNGRAGPEHQALIRLIGNVVEKPYDAG